MTNTVTTPKAWWVGSIRLGPFTVPIRMVPLVKNTKVTFNGVVERQVKVKEGRKTVTKTVVDRVRQSLVDSEGNIISKDDVRKGYDLGNGEWAVFTEDEIAAMQEPSDKVVDVQEFVDASSIDPSTVTRSYHVWPGKNGLAEYRLFMDALAPRKRGDCEKAAVVKFVAVKVQYLGVLRRRSDLLALDVLCWQEQVVDCSPIAHQVAAVSSKPEHLDMVRMFVDSKMAPWQHDHYDDVVTARIEHAITERSGQAMPTHEHQGDVTGSIDKVLADLTAMADAASKPAKGKTKGEAPAAA